MQKRANRILSMLLALIMVMTMLPATVFANSETDVFAGWSLTLGEDIGVNFYLAEEAANYTVDVTVAGNKAAYTTATKDGYYVVSVNVAAAQMTDVITLNVKNGDTQVHTGEYTVRQYAEKILTGAYDAEVKELVKQMLNLGAAAQTYFAYNTGMLANKGYEIDTPAAVPTEVPAIALEDNLDGVSLYGMSLLFQSKTAVRFYFVVDGDVANYTFKVGGEACEVKNSEDLYYVEIGDINPQDLGNEITVTVNDALSVSYNPLTYIVRKYNSDSSSAALKNLVQAMYGYYLESLDYLKYQQIIQLGALQTQSGITPWVKNANETFIDFNTVAYTAPNGEYTSLTADAIKLVRGGETYSVANPGQGLLIKESESGHKLKITPWGMTGGHLPIQAHDYFIIEGRFVSTGGDGTTIQIAKSYIYFDGTTATVSTTEPILPQTYNLGNLMRDPDSGHSWSSSGVYMYVADNDAPYLSDWTLEYAPTSNSVIKRIRGDETIDVAIAGRGTLVKYGANALYLNINSWTMGENQPAQDGDIYIIEGDFYNAATKATIHLSKTYVYLNGADVEFSTEMPTLPTVIEGGAMQSHSNSHSDNGIYFKLDANAAPYNGWDYEYTQTSVDNLKLIRNGVETSIGIVGRPLIVKYGETDYYLKLEQWNVGGVYGMNGGSAPITTDDILIVEGDFKYGDVTLNITKSYVYFDGSKWVCSAEEPAQEKTVDVVSLTAHSNGWNSTSAESAGGMTFAAAENDAPFATDWSLRYKPVSSDVIKLIRDGVEYTIANTGADTIIKYSATEYYLEFWPFAEHKPMLAGDELIIEGLFFNEANNTYINVEKTNIILNADGTAAVIAGGYIDAGSLSNHSNGINGTDGIYATLAANSAPYDGWNIEYAPLSADSYYVIRNGEQINIGIPGRGTLVKYSDTEYYLKLTQWCTNHFAFTTSDIFVIEGLWKQNTGGDATLKIEKTYLYYDGSAWTFATELPTVVNGGVMQSHSNSHGNNGIYFTMAANAAPHNSDWSLEYTQTSTDNIKLIRDNQTISIGIVGRPLIIKYGETDYYLKLEGWNIGDYGVNGQSKAITTDDVIIVEGNFKYGDVTLNITKSYVYYDGSAWVCTAEEPVEDTVVELANIAAHSVNGWTSKSAAEAGGMYFTVSENAAPGGSWEEVHRYKPVSSDVIKLIRNGVESNIANTGANTIIKYSATEYYFEFWPFANAKPMLAGDRIIIEGLFYNAANDVYINVEKTYITLNAGGTITVVNKFVDNEADTEFGKVVLPTSNKNMTIGVWNGSYHVFDHKQLQELQAAGITKIVGIDTQWIGTTDVNGWLDRVYSYGISVIFDLRGWDGETVPDYASHPGVLGFLMYDEPSTQQFDELAALKAKFDAIDAFDGKLFYVNLLSSCVADSSLFGDGYNKLKTDYDQYYVTEFLNKLDIQVLSWDNYSLISQADDTSAKGIRTDYFYNFEVMANKAARNNLPLWYIMLAAGHNSGAENTVYNAPTAEELRWQMAVAMTYGVQNIDQYVYVSHESDYSSMVKYETWEPTALYYDIKTVNNEYLAWDNIFTAYNWVGVGKYSANSKDTMLDQLENCLTLSNYGIAGISASENMLIGVFENNGSKAYMLTNAGSTSTSWFSGDVGDGREFNMADSTVTLTLDAADYKCVAVINNGEISYVAVNNNQVTLNVEAYEGVFVIPVLN